MYTGNRNCQNFDPNVRRLTKLEPNEIFNDFAISREQFDEIDSNFFYLFFILKDYRIRYLPYKSNRYWGIHTKLIIEACILTLYMITENTLNGSVSGTFHISQIDNVGHM